MHRTHSLAVTLALASCAAPPPPRAARAAPPAMSSGAATATPGVTRVCISRAPVLPSVVVGPGRIRLYLDYLPDGLLASPPAGADAAEVIVVDVTAGGATLVATVGCALAAALDARGEQYFLCTTSDARALTVQRLRGTDRLEPVLPAPFTLADDLPRMGLVLAVPPAGPPVVLYRETSDGPPDDGGCYAQALRPGARRVSLGSAWGSEGPLAFVSDAGITLLVPSGPRDAAPWQAADLRATGLVPRAALVTRAAPRPFGLLPSTSLGADGALEIRLSAGGTVSRFGTEGPDTVARFAGAYPLGGPTVLPDAIDLAIQYSLDGRALVLRRGASEVRVDDRVLRGNEFYYDLEASRASCDAAGCVVAFARGGYASPSPPSPFCVARLPSR